MNGRTSIKEYTWVWLILLALLVATWAFSRVNLGPWSLALAMLIALAKMLLILIYFMNLRHSNRLTWIIAGTGFLWLLIFVELTLSDYLTRGYSWSQ